MKIYLKLALWVILCINQPILAQSVEKINEQAKEIVSNINLMSPGRPKTVPIDWDKVTITHQFHDINIRSYMETGILNIHQIKMASPGSGYYPESRLNLELNLADLESGFGGDKHIENLLLPKYAFMMAENGVNSAAIQLPDEGSYGSIIMVLNDDVKQRATYTTGDYLGDHETNIKNVRGRFNEAEGILPLADTSKHPNYEVQIWGHLSFHDAKEFLVTDDTPLSVIDELKEVGLPIYKISADLKQTSNYATLDKTIIFEGD
ncbi:MAG: hypothetical protein KBD78_13815 [Oligoflexales bacterium]|nr:hypothetical protein [Oligoflexales bacterium]